MCCLATRIHSEKCVVKRFRRFANVIDSTYTNLDNITYYTPRDRGSTVVKVLRYKSERRWFDPSRCQWIFHLYKILPIVLWPWGQLSL